MVSRRAGSRWFRLGLAALYLAATVLALGQGRLVAAEDGTVAWVEICADGGISLLKVEGPDAEALLAAGLAVEAPETGEESDGDDRSPHAAPPSCPLCVLSAAVAFACLSPTETLVPPLEETARLTGFGLESGPHDRPAWSSRAIRGPPILL
ncbi:MAG: hypothetical protein Kilf2KO_30030 [Rhodospirillales bacterium]